MTQDQIEERVGESQGVKSLLQDIQALSIDATHNEKLSGSESMSPGEGAGEEVRKRSSFIARNHLSAVVSSVYNFWFLLSGCNNKQ